MASSNTDEESLVLNYLQHISKSIDFLLPQDQDGTSATSENATSQSPEYYMDRIARNLLTRVSSPQNLSLPVPPELILTEFYGDDGSGNSNENGNGDTHGKEKKPTRIKSRIDALRNIYRGMAPIALDVAARISALLVSKILEQSHDNDDNVPANSSTSGENVDDGDVGSLCTNCFCLYAIWLPIAPQIAQIVMDLFQWDKFVSPLQDNSLTYKIQHDNDMDVDGNVETKEDDQKAIAVFSETAYGLIKFFADRGDHSVMKQWWEWTKLFRLLGRRGSTNHDEEDNVDMDMEMKDDASMADDEEDDDEFVMRGWAERPYDYVDATKWFTARAVANLLNLTPTSRQVFIKRLGQEEEMVPWVLHPWIITDEEVTAQENHLRGIVALVQNCEVVEIRAPSPVHIRQCLSLPSSLTHLGNGLVLPRKNTLNATDGSEQMNADEDGNRRQGLIMTETTSRNLSLLGSALCSDPYPPPILVCGPRGSGKSSLIRELAHYCAPPSNGSKMDELLELHVDEETDSKTLLGTYAATDIPGEFTWRPGALTNAVRKGKWVLLEDVESCPAEIQAALVKLFEERVLPLGVDKTEKCHPNFRMFGTCTTATLGASSHNGNRRLRKGVSSAGSGGKRLIHPGLWRKVHVDPLPYSELQTVSRDLFHALPQAVSDAALNVLRKIDKSGRTEDLTRENDEQGKNDTDEEKKESGSFNNRSSVLGNGRHSSVRDLVKLLSRISSTVHFEPGATFCTESQRILCMAESFDIFAGWCPCRHLRKDFVAMILAPIWGITTTVAIRYIEERQPQVQPTKDYIEVGRSTIRYPPVTLGNMSNSEDTNFAETNYSLRLMEAAGVCITQNEPTLLVGETGCGKTTVIQRLASLSRHELVVQNLSLQTDSTDLLGGYRPLEIRHIARNVYTDFVQLFVSSFSKSQNAQFLDYVTEAYEKGNWKRLSQCFLRASKMGLDKIKQQKKDKKKSAVSPDLWFEFKRTSERFEKQRVACDTGLAFVFTEGALVDAIRSGKWVLLDEINLASSETLERLCGLLDDAQGSVTLTEKGDSEALQRHPNFRIFAAMNPATDAGKKDLPSSLRSRFTEIYVDELIDEVELRSVAARYLSGVIAPSDKPLEHTESVISAVDVYLRCRRLSEQTLVDGGGQRPRYTLRTMCRALSAARNLIVEQRFGIKRAILEGFELGFEGALDIPSRIALRKLLTSTLGKGLSVKELDHPGRRPNSGLSGDEYVLSKPFWLKVGMVERNDWSEASTTSKRSRFVLTPSMTKNLRRLTRACASGPWPILLEGPTSAGKTTMVEYLAAKCGHKCVRINNHEHTDVQEYTGSYASDSTGKLCFVEGILVQALRRGHWVILDELNLAPSEVLEALNRLLDDNRELYLPEINEVVKPHPNFRLFATQNPSGAYGGRKPLSRAFRNRFVEMHIGDIPEKEMITILELRCHCPPSHAKILVKIMSALRKRRSKSGVFRGKDGLITPRDLLRWAERKATTKHELGLEGYMLLAERLRSDDERSLVQEIIEEHMKIEINTDQIYYGGESESRRKLKMIATMDDVARSAGLSLQAIAPTKSLLRLLTLVERCVKQKEPVLLVGDTGCGKTTVVQLMSVILDRELQIVNCHASTETSDLLGGLRPLRGRKLIYANVVSKAREIVKHLSLIEISNSVVIPNYLKSDDLKPPANISPLITEFSKEIRSVSSKCSKKIKESKIDGSKSPPSQKKRKLENGTSESILTEMNLEKLDKMLNELDLLLQQYASLFEWVDGPLVSAMRIGNLFLLDEMSLAEDAVLERLNSVLEPSRTLVLAEKGGDLSDDASNDSAEVNAHENFRIFATMNPGGDFGKRELSPALRSRFTEIWVPPVTDSADIDLVLSQTLNASFVKYQVTHIMASTVADIKQCMLNYVNWFNNDICNKPMSTMADFVLSLRDVLAWARFVVETTCKNKELGIWSTYAHGAALMHLDGLGLGTGLAHDEVAGTKMIAKEYLTNQIPRGDGIVSGFEDEYESVDESSLYANDKFGIHPFFISTGSEQIPTNLGFKLSAPTTGMNLRRVLRAMQISKPILLEGSPGVGKTSLISALAASSGHKLVRINLSEQTDISDLMGSDLPMPEETTDENGNTSTGGSFKWCDGALLKAIKNGHWVLLDELNLASQSVLEGLNSCLDHRASVYIPELGETFACPPTFRIFAAQNPLAQGGGRKGLPKSFLNRFTKVYVEALSKEDLKGIVQNKFPILPSDLVESIVLFNDSVQKDIEDRKYGQLGSPWEFNLRDVFRWCDLIKYHYDRNGSLEHGAFSDTIYIQRLRSEIDRSQLSKRYQQCFGNLDCIRIDPLVKYENEFVNIGIARLAKNVNILPPSDSIILGEEPSLLRHLVRPMEAVSLCIQMSWPCLLVGPAASGKSTILKSLAESCNRQLEEIALTTSSDVNELIGTFEQIDAAEVEARLLSSLRNICNHACLHLTDCELHLKYLELISLKYHDLMAKLEVLRRKLTTPVVVSEKAALKSVENIIVSAKKASTLSGEFRQACEKELTMAERDYRSFVKERKSKNDSNAIHFRWFDGILVQALEMGYWLHLENVNFCPSSVLDRLNPLMETGGELVLTECGIDDDLNNGGFGTSRVVKPHPNFRLFLSMNPSFGEVSRAMRNRCIEVSLLPPSVSKYPADVEHQDISKGPLSSSKTLDALDSVWGHGLRSSTLAKSMLDSHEFESFADDFVADDIQPSRNLAEWAKLLKGSFCRGFYEENDFKSSQQLAYEIHHEEINQIKKLNYHSEIEGKTQIVSKVFTRHMLERASALGNVVTDARLLKFFLEESGSLPLGVTYFGETTHSTSNVRTKDFNKYAPSLVEGDSRLPKILVHLTSRFIQRSSKLDSKFRARFLDGYCPKITRSIKRLSKTYLDIDLSSPTAKLSIVDRLSQVLEENSTSESLSSFHIDLREMTDLSVMEISVCIHENKIDRSHVTCPVTPILQPFFDAIDIYLNVLMSSCLDGTKPLTIMSMRAFFVSRDRLWRFLKQSKFIMNSSFLGFDEGGFLVHWTWLKKRFDDLSSNASSDAATKVKRNVDLIMGTIDRAVQIESGDIRLFSGYRKKIGHPLVPAQAQDSTSIRDLQLTASKLSLLNEEDFGYQRLLSGTSASVSMKSLFDAQHIMLFSDPRIKSETLNALCMAHWATTDEMSATTRIQTRNYNTAEVKNLLLKKLDSLQNDFSTAIRACTVDTTINTVDNKLDLHDLERLQEVQLKEGSKNDLIMQRMLSAFGDIQLTQLSEFICIREEKWIIDNLIMIIRKSENTEILQKLGTIVAPRIHNFIESVLSRTIWPVSDLRPYQSLLWIIESGSVTTQSINRFFKCSYSTLISTLSRHYWCNSFNDLNSISDEIASPSFWSMKDSDSNYGIAPRIKMDVMAGLSHCVGEPRVNQNVVSEFLFRLQGFKRVAEKSSQSIPFLTIENQDARSEQVRKLFQFLSCSLEGLGKNDDLSDTIKFLLENMMDALHGSFDTEESYISFRNAVFDRNEKALLSLKGCKHSGFVRLARSILPELLSSMKKLDDTPSKLDFSMASIYVGILRFHLALPASPLDPGKKPAAKVEQWNHHIDYLGSKLVAMRMEFGLISGNFEPDNDEATTIIKSLSHGEMKRFNEEKKCVERPTDIPPFYDLYKDVHHFASTVASAEKVLELLRTLQDDERKESVTTKQQKEVNWQASVASFCNQMTTKYSCYEDITIPFLGALGMIRNGLRSVLHHKTVTNDVSRGSTTKLQDRLLQYPNVKHSGNFDVNDLHEISMSFSSLTDINNEVFLTKKMEKSGQLSFLFSTLSNLCILKDRQAIDQEKIVEISSYIFRSIADAWNASNSQTDTSDQDDETEEERLERQYKEQFPDHAKEFNKIVEAIETLEFGGDVDTEDEDTKLESTVNDFSITEEQLVFLCDLHGKLFSKHLGTESDSLRTKSFISTYIAAAQLNNAVVLSSSHEPETKRLGAHCYAVALSSRNNPGSTLSFESFMRSDSSIDLDFHKDPNPQELLKADLPLRSLLQRISQLMRAFPGNSILISIGQVAERIRQMDAKTTSLGKVLVGFEVILKKSQEWEQHASQRVALGSSLQEVSQLVARWRKLELQSWSSLLNVRDQKHIIDAKRHWMRLYKVLIIDDSSNDEDHKTADLSKNSCAFPKWLWMGQSNKLKNITTDALDASDSDDLFETVKVLDTFILTSGIGQFSERLRLIDAFSSHLKKECETSTIANRRKVSKAIILDSFVKHYRNLSAMITRAKESSRKPIEKKLKDEVKLAKWDEQSYYALSESAEKSHRKLMMIVHDYEEILHTSVGRVLEENFLNGIRPHSEVGNGPTAQPITEIPSNSSIFPEIQFDSSKLLKGSSTMGKSRFSIDNLKNLRIKKREWTKLDPGFVADKYILGIQKYSKKMDNIFSSNLDCHSTLGVNCATDICDSIFERIKVLREKGTKPMKERALVDMFKLLKKQGYSSMKWSIPKQIREMNSLLHIKSPEESVLDTRNDSVLIEAENYFRRCTVEIARLRSEAQMMGSVYMSKREMDLMVGFSDHGLLMLCQQRANVTKIIHDIEAVFTVLGDVDTLNSDSRLSRNQVCLLDSNKKFNNQYSIALESMRQTFVMIKNISSQIDTKKSQCNDIIGVIDEAYSTLSSIYESGTTKNLVTQSHISSIENTKQNLQTVIDNISNCAKINNEANILPQEIFNPSLDELRSSLVDANTIITESMQPSKSATLLVDDTVPTKVAEIVKATLLASQTLHDGFITSDDMTADEQGTTSKSLWENHSQSLKEWDSIGIQHFAELLQDLVGSLQKVGYTDKSYIEGICSDACVLVVKVLDMCQRRLGETLKFYRSVAKFEYIKLRLFRVLIAKGYCADDVDDGGEADGEGGDGNTKFEDDVEGTGMGEGEGKNDVTDQIENEEQLLGLKGDDENEQQKEQKELNEEEAETGMEMENEFDGEMFDVPDKKEEDENQDDDDGEEELDREMGDGSDPNEQVVDEKMWDEDEDEEEQNQEEEEKFEKDSKMAGEAMQDEMRTKEDEEATGEEGKDDQNPESAGDNQHEEDAPKNEDGQDNDNDADKNDEEDMVNNDYEDDYEDKHEGVDVRNEENQEPDDNDEDAMDLDNELDLNDGDEDDGGAMDGEDAAAESGGEEEPEEEGNDKDGFNEIDENDEGDEDEDADMESEAIQNAHQTLGDDDQMNAEDEKEEEEEKQEEPEQDQQDINASDDKHEEAHGVASKSGADTVKRQEEEDDNEEDGEGDDEEEDQGAGEGENDDSNAGAGQSDANSGEIQNGSEGSGTKPSPTSMDAPNPFRDPGDAEKFWHKKLNVISDAKDDEAEEIETNEKEDPDNGESNADGDFEFTSKDQDNSTQVLGGVAEDDTTEMNQDDEKDQKPSESLDDETMNEDQKDAEMPKRQTKKQDNSRKKESDDINADEKADANIPSDEEEKGQEDNDVTMTDEETPDQTEDPEEDIEPDNKIITDLDQLQMRDGEEHNYQTQDMVEDEEHAGTTFEDMEEARMKWSELQAETNSLSRRLCEKLRLVMEPLVASKLRGDYRTGKRINMKRVIGYIASGYRKDKIWLRRTKPGKRDYRVLLAVDNSESMRNGAGDMALTALATLANGMSQLEIGEVGVASFGEEMKLLHPFHAPFTAASGVDVVSNFKFSDKRTRTALCVESALAALESQSSTSSSLQLVFMISDGRIERDSRERLRRIVREMTEKNILLIMVVVEGDEKGGMKPKDSIVNMKEVSFEKGKPKVKHFIDDYPFPYYMVLQDMHTLPEVLGDALKQWFEMMAQNQSQG